MKSHEDTEADADREAGAQFDWICSKCKRVVRLFAKGTSLCGSCFLRSGASMPVDTYASFQQEQRTRERMVQRGGAARHLVRKGLT